MVDFNKLAVPNYSTDEIKNKSQSLITSIGEPPIEVDLIAEKLGFNLIPLQGLKYLSSTDSYLAYRCKEIVYDPDVSPVRIRFSIAHELGHFILHKEIIDAISFNSIDEWKESLNNIPGWFWSKIEKQANEFAGNILAPRDFLLRVILNYKDKLELAKNIIPNDLGSIREFLAIPLAKRFDVSQDVIRIRLEREDINPYELIYKTGIVATIPV